MLRWLTAGESHGPALTAILEGLPAGLELTGAEGTDSALLALALGVEAVLPPAPVADAVQLRC